MVDAEGISTSEEELLEALAPTAERENVAAEKLLEDLRSAGRLEELREELAVRKAIDLIAASATPIPLARAQAREQLWTPEKQAGGSVAGAGAAEPAGRLWTPTDQASAS
jgi:hypothetical protein